jgi:tetratricopeptide (TPR) repeat protein
MNEKDTISIATEYFDRAYKLHMDGKLENAILAYRASIRIFPSARAYSRLAEVYSLQGKFNLAIELCKKAIELEPQLGSLYHDIGSYLVSIEMDEEAISWFERAIQINSPNSNCYSYYNLGKIYEKEGDWMNALRNFNKAVAIDGTYEPAQNAIIKLSTLLN